MTQYCRYCCYLCVGNGTWCDKRGREMTEATAKSPNRCHDFCRNPIDAFAENEKGHSPRIPRKKLVLGGLDEGIDAFEFIFWDRRT